MLMAAVWAIAGFSWGTHYGYRAGERSGFREGVDKTIAEVERIISEKNRH